MMTIRGSSSVLVSDLASMDADYSDAIIFFQSFLQHTVPIKSLRPLENDLKKKCMVGS